MSQGSRHFRKANLTVLCMAGVLVSCTTPRISAPPELQPTDARGTIAVLHASGVQIYQCKRANDGRLLWSFLAPEATLKDDTGQLVVKHYAGPTWEAPDGSKVTGKVLRQTPNAQEPDNSTLAIAGNEHRRNWPACEDALRATAEYARRTSPPSGLHTGGTGESHAVSGGLRFPGVAKVTLADTVPVKYSPLAVACWL